MIVIIILCQLTNPNKHRSSLIDPQQPINPEINSNIAIPIKIYAFNFTNFNSGIKLESEIST